MNNIVFYGFMGTGKNLIAKKLARDYHLLYMEMDEVIEKEAGLSINEIFEQLGEEHFRVLERSLVERLAESTGNVISTGGGVVLDVRNIRDFDKNGIGICLWASPEVIYERTKKEKHRPLLNVPDSLQTIKKLLSFREPYYKKIRYHIDTSEMSPEEVLAEVKSIIEKEGNSKEEKA